MENRPGKRQSVPLPGSELPAGLDIHVVGSTFQGGDVNVGNNNVSIGAVHGNVRLSTTDPVRSDSVRIPLANWLSSLDFSQHQSEAFERWTAGTFDWLVDKPEFRAWKTGEIPGILLCIGKPGAGKTTFASRVIHELLQESDAEPQAVTAVCYIYCQYHSTFTILQLLELILKQIILQCPSAPIERLQKLKDKGLRPSLDQIASILQANFKQLSSIFLVIDALDECFTEEVRHRLLGILRSLVSVRILLTSRPIPTIQSALQGTLILIINPNRQDIGTHLYSRALNNPALAGHVRKIARPELETKIMEQAGGMFLLAELHITHLSEQTNFAAFLDALETLPEEATAIYARALERIRQQKPNLKQLAFRALSWIFYSRRPFKMTELQHAIAGGVAEENELADEALIISSCAGLLIMNQETKHVNFIHYTVQEYFRQVSDEFLPEAEIAREWGSTFKPPCSNERFDISVTIRPGDRDGCGTT